MEKGIVFGKIPPFALTQNVASRYTGFAQTSLWRRTPVYRLCANFPVASQAYQQHVMSTPDVAQRYTDFVF